MINTRTLPPDTPKGGIRNDNLANCLLRSAGHRAGQLETILVHGAALVMIAVMLIVVVDVAFRYLFNSPIKWVYPLISRYLMIYMIFLALADTLRRGQHIGVDFLVRPLGVRARSILELAAYVPALVIFSLIFWLSSQLILLQYRNDDRVMDSLGWPTWIATLAVAIGLGVLTARILLRIVALIVRVGNPAADVTASYGAADADEFESFHSASQSPAVRATPTSS